MPKKSPAKSESSKGAGAARTRWTDEEDTELRALAEKHVFTNSKGQVRVAWWARGERARIAAPTSAPTSPPPHHPAGAPRLGQDLGGPGDPWLRPHLGELQLPLPQAQ